MKIKTNIGLIIYKEEIEEEFNKIFEEVANKYLEKKVILNSTIATSSICKGWRIFQIHKKAFRNYYYFDDFLMYFVSMTKNNPNILVLGHNDEQGYFWKDYN